MAVVLSAVAIAGCGSDVTDPFDAVAALSGEVCGKDVVASAVLVADDVLITAAHSVAGATGPLVARFEDGAERPATVTALDTVRDIAALRIAPQDRRPIALGDSVTETGRTLRLDSDLERVAVAHTGASTLDITGEDIYRNPSDVVRSGVRIEADIGPGHSGGPILNTDGEMVGMVFAESRRTGFAYGLAAAEVERFVATVPATDWGAGECR